MSEDIIIRNCPPTLAGMKPGTCFHPCQFADEDEMRGSVRLYSREQRAKWLLAAGFLIFFLKSHKEKKPEQIAINGIRYRRQNKFPFPGRRLTLPLF